MGEPLPILVEQQDAVVPALPADVIARIIAFAVSNHREQRAYHVAQALDRLQRVCRAWRAAASQVPLAIRATLHLNQIRSRVAERTAVAWLRRCTLARCCLTAQDAATMHALLEAAAANAALSQKLAGAELFGMLRPGARELPPPPAARLARLHLYSVAVRLRLSQLLRWAARVTVTPAASEEGAALELDAWPGQAPTDWQAAVCAHVEAAGAELLAINKQTYAEFGRALSRVIFTCPPGATPEAAGGGGRGSPASAAAIGAGNAFALIGGGGSNGGSGTDSGSSSEAGSSSDGDSDPGSDSSTAGDRRGAAAPPPPPRTSCSTHEMTFHRLPSDMATQPANYLLFFPPQALGALQRRLASEPAACALRARRVQQHPGGTPAQPDGAPGDRLLPCFAVSILPDELLLENWGPADWTEERLLAGIMQLQHGLTHSISWGPGSPLMELVLSGRMALGDSLRSMSNVLLKPHHDLSGLTQLTSLHALLGAEMPDGVVLPPNLLHLSCLCLHSAYEAGWMGSQQLGQLKKVTVVAHVAHGSPPPCLDLSQLLPPPGHTLGTVHIGFVGRQAPPVSLDAGVRLPAAPGCWREVEVAGSAVPAMAVPAQPWMRVAGKSLSLGMVGEGRLVVRCGAPTLRGWLAAWLAECPGLTSVTLSAATAQRKHLRVEVAGGRGGRRARAVERTARGCGFGVVATQRWSGLTLALTRPTEQPEAGGSWRHVPDPGSSEEDVGGSSSEEDVGGSGSEGDVDGSSNEEDVGGSGNEEGEAEQAGEEVGSSSTDEESAGSGSGTEDGGASSRMEDAKGGSASTTSPRGAPHACQ
eukprot:scaffold21.g2229.t1